MTEFDPYHKWLGIAIKDQPPHHYRLLGIDLFESDLDVIDAAANKQMAFLQTCASGAKLVFSQRLLNEISAARLCLLNAKDKSAYDAELKVRIATAKAKRKVAQTETESHSDSSLRMTVQTKAAGYPVATDVAESDGINDWGHHHQASSSYRIKPGYALVPKLLVVLLVVCTVTGLLVHFGNSNKQPVAGRQEGQENASTESHQVVQKTPAPTRPEMVKAAPSVTSLAVATGKNETKADPQDGSSLLPQSITNSIGMKLVLISAGEFMMGTPKSDGDFSNDESPLHLVKFTKPFYLGVYEVTQREYAAFSFGLNPSELKSDMHPVTNVDWGDAVNFCQRLTEPGKRVYRLPTEAEWEYACRGGTNNWLQPGKLSNYAWYSENSGEKAHSVGMLQPNPFGLHDMLGNASEWCSDWYGTEYYSKSSTLNPIGPTEGSSRTTRGGFWNSSAKQCRFGYRGAQAALYRGETTGFRVLLETGVNREVSVRLDQVPTSLGGSTSATSTPQNNNVGTVTTPSTDTTKGPNNNESLTKSKKTGSGKTSLPKKSKITRADIVGVWRYKAGTNPPREITLFANGMVNKPAGPDTWTFQGSTLIVRLQDKNAPGGVWVGINKVSADGKFVEGFTQDNTAISGEKLRP